MSDLNVLRVQLHGGNGTEPLPDHVHAVLAGWMDDDHNHENNRKPYTMRRFAVTNDGLDLHVGALTRETAERLLDSIAMDRATRLGRQRLVAVGVVVEQQASWEDLLQFAKPVNRITFRFFTPMVFRSGRATNVAPSPAQVFGHLRSAWATWAPADLQPNIDLGDLHILTRRLQGSTEHWSARHQQWPGFIGTVEFDLDAVPERERRVLHALAQLAPFTGTGANTTVGMGSTDVRTPSK